MIRSELVVTKKTPLAPRGLVMAERPLGAEVGAAVATAFALTVGDTRHGDARWLR